MTKAVKKIKKKSLLETSFSFFENERRQLCRVTKINEMETTDLYKRYFFTF
jgi:DNA-binding MarR family transcriptional regulator